MLMRTCVARVRMRCGGGQASVSACSGRVRQKECACKDAFRHARYIRCSAAVAGVMPHEMRYAAQPPSLRYDLFSR